MSFIYQRDNRPEGVHVDGQAGCGCFLAIMAFVFIAGLATGLTL